MKLIVGLGNPGEEYKNNRHNVGFMFVDYLFEQNQKLIHSASSGLILGKVEVSKIKYQNDNLKFKNNKYLLSKTYHLSPNVILAKPQTFMNRSGAAVKKLLITYSLSPNNLIVVHDDLDIPFGMFKIHREGPKLHNGIESVEKTLKTKDFLRVRIGVDNRLPEKRINGETYVLQNFLPDEKEKLTEIFSSLARQISPYLDTTKK